MSTITVPPSIQQLLVDHITSLETTLPREEHVVAVVVLDITGNKFFMACNRANACEFFQDVATNFAKNSGPLMLVPDEVGQ